MFKTNYGRYLILFIILLSACRPAPGAPHAAVAPTATRAAAPATGTLKMKDTPTAPSPPTSEQLSLLKSLKRQGVAPELSNQVWLNSPPLKLADLGGKVVLIDFWTFG